MADSVEAGEISPAIAHALAALGNVRIRSIEAERKLRETDELLKRIEAIEAHEQSRSGRYR